MASLIPSGFIPDAIPPLTTPPTTIRSVPTPPSGIVATTITYRPSLPPGFIRPTIVSVSLLSPGILPTHIPSIPPPLGVEPNFHDPVTLAVPIIAVAVITSVLAIVLLLLRLYSTFKITRTASWDDGAIVIALVFSLTYAGLIISVRDYARHGWDQPISAFEAKFFKIIAAEVIIGALAFLFSKVSVLLLLLRLFSQSRTLRYLAYFGILWASITSIMVLVAGGTLCAPRHDESGVGLAVIMRCRSGITWGVAQGALNMALNFYIFALPIPFLWRLRTGHRKKIGALAVLMMGFT